MSQKTAYYDLDLCVVDTSIPLIIDEAFIIDLIITLAKKGHLQPEFGSRVKNIIEHHTKRNHP